MKTRFVPTNLLLLSAVCGIGNVSAAVVTSTACSVGTQSASGALNCSINPANSAPSSAASITLNQVTALPASGGLNSFTADVTGSVTAVPLSDFARNIAVSSNASASVNINYQFLTGGPVRPGVLVVSSNAPFFQSGPGNDSASATVSIGGLSDSCIGNNGSCSFFSSNLYGGSRSFGFTLGQTFNFSFSEVFQAMGDPSSEGTGFARGDANIIFRLYEANGTTPIAFSNAAPEPSSFSLLLLAAPAAWLYRRRQRR